MNEEYNIMIEQESAASSKLPTVFCFFDEQNLKDLCRIDNWAQLLERNSVAVEKMRSAPELSPHAFVDNNSSTGCHIFYIVRLGQREKLTFSSIDKLIGTIYDSTQWLGGANILLSPTINSDDDEKCHGKKCQKTKICKNTFSHALNSCSDLLRYCIEAAAIVGYKFSELKKSSPSDLPRAKLQMIDTNDEESMLYKNLKEMPNYLLQATDTARDLILMPPNIATPEYIANKAAEILEPLGVKIRCLEEKELEKKGFGAMLSVSKGSSQPAVLLAMEWAPYGGSDDEYDIALVGKGVTFDSGGISLKSSDNMQDMKGDMSGAAIVIGIMELLARNKTKSRVVGVIGLVENMPSGSASRPGDIVKSLSGKTIEILNTDAEGRLVLADAVWYTQTNYKINKMIDFATLTGASIIALGVNVAPCMGNDCEMIDTITSYGNSVGEPMWKLPMDAIYEKMLDSPIADIANISIKGGGAGTITGAQFIGAFVKDNVSWVHIDVAGAVLKNSRYADNSIKPFGMRTIFHYIHSEIASSKK